MNISSFVYPFTKRNLQSAIRSYKNKKKSFLSKKSVLYSISKREKFVIGVSVLSIGLFSLEHTFGKTGIVGTLFLSILTDLLLFWALREDMRENFLPQVFILPFLYSFSFGLFYFVLPPRYISRIILTGVYALGIYSLFLSENIFTVSSIRTIALLSSARIVSFVISLLSYTFLAKIVFSLQKSIFTTSLLIFTFSFFLIFHGLWSYNLEKEWRSNGIWSAVLSLCLFELSLILWFWPSSPTIIALFLAGIYYTVVGLSHVWFDKRLFRGVLWEYIWVAVSVFIVLISLTQWG